MPPAVHAEHRLSHCMCAGGPGNRLLPEQHTTYLWMTCCVAGQASAPSRQCSIQCSIHSRVWSGLHNALRGWDWGGESSTRWAQGGFGGLPYTYCPTGAMVGAKPCGDETPEERTLKCVPRAGAVLPKYVCRGCLPGCSLLLSLRLSLRLLHSVLPRQHGVPQARSVRSLLDGLLVLQACHVGVGAAQVGLRRTAGQQLPLTSSPGCRMSHWRLAQLPAREAAVCRGAACRAAHRRLPQAKRLGAAVQVHVHHGGWEPAVQGEQLPICAEVDDQASSSACRNAHAMCSVYAPARGHAQPQSTAAGAALWACPGGPGGTPPGPGSSQPGRQEAGLCLAQTVGRLVTPRQQAARSSSDGAYLTRVGIRPVATAYVLRRSM